MKIGILGGTFNPVHNGHIHIAEQALRKLRLDKIIFVPAYIPPHKKLRGKVTAADRLRMLRLATGNNKKFGVSAFEIKNKGKSYSIRTVRHLKQKFGKKAKLFFIIGSDSLKGLKDWKNIKSLMRLARFAAVSRPGFAMNRPMKNVLRIAVPGKDISSTGIRKSIKSGKPAGNSMPQEAHDYARQKNLYS